MMRVVSPWRARGASGCSRPRGRDRSDWRGWASDRSDAQPFFKPARAVWTRSHGVGVGNAVPEMGPKKKFAGGPSSGVWTRTGGSP